MSSSLLDLCLDVISATVSDFNSLNDIPIDLRDMLLDKVLELDRDLNDTDVIPLLDPQSSIFRLRGRRASDSIFTPVLADYLILNCARLNVLVLERIISATDSVVSRLIENNRESLQELSVSFCPKAITASLTDAVAKCTSLTSLALNGYRNLTDTLLQPIATNCLRLQRLEIRNSRCSETARYSFLILVLD